jgi:hypothetical protein
VHRPSFVTGAVLLVAGSLALSACGSSSSSTSSSSAGAASSSSSPSQSSATSSVSLPGGSFCAQATAALAQFGQLGAGLGAGALSTLAGIKQLLATDTGVLDSLDSSVPSEIAADVHTIRVALDQANSQAQSATSLQQLSAAFIALSNPAVNAAGAHISSYVKTACGISSASTT